MQLALIQGFRTNQWLEYMFSERISFYFIGNSIDNFHRRILPTCLANGMECFHPVCCLPIISQTSPPTAATAKMAPSNTALEVYFTIMMIETRGEPSFGDVGTMKNSECLSSRSALHFSFLFWYMRLIRFNSVLCA